MLQLAIDAKPGHIGCRVLFRLPIAIWSMLLNSFAMSVGFFMLIPLVSVYYTNSLGFTAANVGLALAVRQFSQQGLMLATGSVAERVGYRPVLAAGMLVRAVGFGMFVIADTLPRLLIASFVAAVGGAFFEVSARALMAVLVRPEQRTSGFSLWSLASNVGLAIGPLVGALLIRSSFSTVCMVAASAYIVGAAVIMLLIPGSARKHADVRRPPGFLKTIGVVTQNRTFVIFSAMMCGFYLLTQQLFITVPLEAERLTGSTGSLGALYLVNSIAAITLQIPLIRIASRFLTPLQAIILGMLLLALAMATMGIAGGLPLILAAVAVMAVARVLVDPVLNTTIAAIASRAEDGLLASYFGFSALSIAIGGAAGQLIGGWLFDLGQRYEVAALPWIALTSVGLGVFVMMLAFSMSGRADSLNDQQTSP